MKQSRQVYSIQFLRGLAAVLVVIHHACNFLAEHGVGGSKPLDFKIGAIGVDIFFVISGFIMFYSTKSHSGSIKDTLVFLKKRVVRIVPLYWLITGAVVVGYILVPSSAATMSISLYDFLMSIAFLPFMEANGRVQPLIGQGWTLNYEAIFYVILGFTLLFARKRKVLVLFVLFSVLNIAAWLLGSYSVMLKFYGSPLLYEFLVGMVLGAAYLNGVGPNKWLLLFGVILGGYILTLDSGFREYVSSEWHRLAVWGSFACVLVLACLKIESAFQERCPKILIFLGDASYSIYLIHVLAFSIIWRIIRGLVVARNIPDVFIALVLVICATAIGVMVYWFVERNLVRLFSGERKKVLITTAR